MVCFPMDGSDPEDITDLEQVRKPFRWTEAFNPNGWVKSRKRGVHGRVLRTAMEKAFAGLLTNRVWMLLSVK